MAYSDEFPDSTVSGSPKPGTVSIFRYGAKYKKTLPYWDRNPLCYVFGSSGGAFYGLNLHYQIPTNRKAVLSYIDGGGDPTKVRGYHKYLKSYMDTPFIVLSMNEWDKALSYGMEEFRRVIGSVELGVDAATVQKGGFYK